MYVKINAVALLIVLSSAASYGFEAASNQPGTRAMGMAGIYHAQSDDSTAIWYNPAGLQLNSTVSGEFSLEIGEIHTLAAPGSLKNETALKYLSYYFKPEIFDGRWKDLGIGVAYFKTGKVVSNVEDTWDVHGSQSYGRVQGDYHHISIAANHAITGKWAAAVALESMSVDVHCLDDIPQSFCVKEPAWGSSASFSTAYQWALPAMWQSRLNAAVIWRLPLRVGYTDNKQSLGGIIDAYLPGRPDTRTLAFHWQYPGKTSLLNLNLVLEHILWADAVRKAGANIAHQNNYVKRGVSAEWLLPFGNQSLGLRMGVSQAKPNNQYGIPVRVFAVGAGISVGKSNFIDFAWERKFNSSGPDTELGTVASINYSRQY